MSDEVVEPNDSESVETEVVEPEFLNLSKEQLDAILAKLLETSKETLRMALESFKGDGEAALDKGKQFAKAAEALTVDLVKRKITQEEYKDAMENIALAMDAFLVSEGYAKSRKYLTIAVDVLKNMVSMVISALV